MQLRKAPTSSSGSTWIMSAPKHHAEPFGRQPAAAQCPPGQRQLRRGERQLDRARHHLQALPRRDVLLGVEIDHLGADADRKRMVVKASKRRTPLVPCSRDRCMAWQPMPIGLMTPRPVTTTSRGGEIMAGQKNCAGAAGLILARPNGWVDGQARRPVGQPADPPVGKPNELRKYLV